MIRISKLYSVLVLLALLGLSSCDDSLPGQPFAIPVDTLAGRNGNILFSKIYPLEFPPRAEVLNVDPTNGVTTGIDVDGLMLSKPGNERLAYIKIHDIFGAMDLFTIGPTGNQKTVMETEVDAKTHWLVWTSAAISPDGQKVAYGVEDINTGQTSLWIIVSGPGSVGPRPVKVADNFAQATVPFFSPDGNSLAYFTQEHDGISPIIGQDGFAIANVQATPTPNQIYQGQFTLMGDESIEWSPDGSKVMFGVGPELHTYTPGNGDKTLLANATHGAYSPDGSRIVYSDVMAGYQLVIRDLASGNTTPLTADVGFVCYYPQWSPDGKFILYSSVPQVGTDDNLAEIKVMQISNRETKTVGNEALRAFWLRKLNP
ncbi:MAG TPA: hypothetical protein VFH43_14780 [Candidatus Kapabacteria bacterium]|nr:hypothetical protein [Candidatus Kapabacteria bacterium]